MKTQSIFGDNRLDKEFVALVTQVSTNGSAVLNRSSPSASDKKAAYRFINNDKVTPEVTIQRIV